MSAAEKVEQQGVGFYSLPPCEGEREGRWSKMSETGDSGQIRDAVLGTATRLFAQMGYDGVSLDTIAAATGVAPASLTALYRDKRELYLAVMDRGTRQLDTYVAPAFAAFTPDADGLIRVVDRLLDHALEHPELWSMWMQRWMSDAVDIADVEQRFAMEMFRAWSRLVESALAPGVDAYVVLMSVLWLVNGFIHSGLVDEEGHRSPRDPAARRLFRAHLHLVLRQFAASD